MNTTAPFAVTRLSEQARDAMRRPLFHADWLRAVFLHYEADPHALQPLVPFPLDLRDGRAYVSLVAFTLQNLRPAVAPCIGRALFRPASNHGFLNLRTYVRAGGRSGIYFLAEWLNRRIVTPLGRPLFGLPYNFGRLDYRHCPPILTGEVTSRGKRLSYEAASNPAAIAAPCAAGSLDEFLLERYTAFTHWRRLRRYFHVWHPPWPVIPLDAQVTDASLLPLTGPWANDARLIAAHYSPGVTNVHMGPPRFLKTHF